MTFLQETVKLESWNFQGIILGYRRVNPENFSLLAQQLPGKIAKNFLEFLFWKFQIMKSFSRFFQEAVELEGWNFQDLLFYIPILYPENFSSLALLLPEKISIFNEWHLLSRPPCIVCRYFCMELVELHSLVARKSNTANLLKICR